MYRLNRQQVTDTKLPKENKEEKKKNPKHQHQFTLQKKAFNNTAVFAITFPNIYTNRFKNKLECKKNSKMASNYNALQKCSYFLELLSCYTNLKTTAGICTYPPLLAFPICELREVNY